MISIIVNSFLAIITIYFFLIYVGFNNTKNINFIMHFQLFIIILVINYIVVLGFKIKKSIKAILFLI